jgi:hypothetical protein
MAALFQLLLLNTLPDPLQQFLRGRYANIRSNQKFLKLIPGGILDPGTVKERGNLAEQPFPAELDALLCELTIKYYFVSTILA